MEVYSEALFCIVRSSVFRTRWKLTLSSFKCPDTRCSRILNFNAVRTYSISKRPYRCLLSVCNKFCLRSTWAPGQKLTVGYFVNDAGFACFSCKRQDFCNFSSLLQRMRTSGHEIQSTRYGCYYTTGVEDIEKSTKSLLLMCPHEFSEYLKSNKINRCFLIWSDSEQRVIASHPLLKELEDWLNDSSNPYYKQHEAIFLQVGIRSGCLLGAFLWKINRGQGCGGIRMNAYSNVETYLTEGLRLSKRLGVKSALAGLWVGGGKGIIPEPKDRQHIQPEFRQKLFYDYGDFLSSLNGCYIAGMDMGINTYDLYNIHSRTRWAICGPEDIGGSGNAAALLGKGVLCAMEAALDFLNIGSLMGKKVAVQGAGGVGLEVVSGLLEGGVSHVYVTDTSQKRVDDLYDMLVPKSRGRLKVDKVPIGDLNIVNYDCDIFAPCAVGHILTPSTIPGIRAKIICGSANAQLTKEDCCKLLEEKGITYVLEYLPNRMALVNSVYENYGRLYNDPIIERHFDRKWEHSIYVLTQRVLKEAAEKNITVIEAAYQLAEEYSKEPHPIWPGRTRAIVQNLIAGQWHHGNDFWRKRRNFAKSEGCA